MKETIIERVTQLAELKGKKVTVATTEAGVGKNFIDNIKGRGDVKGSVPSVEKLLALAHYFDVSVDYLVGNAEKSAPIPKGGAQSEFLNLLDSLSDDDQSAIMQMLRSLTAKAYIQ
jgi:transcriptional regulator with XRE-family HTH domain